MKSSLSIYTAIVATVAESSLMILPSEAAFAAADGPVTVMETINIMETYDDTDNETITTNKPYGHVVLTNRSALNSLHMNATNLPSNCDGCKMVLALVETMAMCSIIDAHLQALRVVLENDLTYTTDEDGSTGGWETQPVHEYSNSTTPVSIFNEVMLGGTDYNHQKRVAVYFYDLEENPVACATLKPASEEEAQMYEVMFYGESEEEGEDDGPDAEAAKGPGDSENTSAGGLELVSTIVTGMSVLTSAMLVFV